MHRKKGNSEQQMQLISGWSSDAYYKLVAIVGERTLTVASTTRVTVDVVAAVVAPNSPTPVPAVGAAPSREMIVARTQNVTAGGGKEDDGEAEAEVDGERSKDGEARAPRGRATKGTKKQHLHPGAMQTTNDTAMRLMCEKVIGLKHEL